MARRPSWTSSNNGVVSFWNRSWAGSVVIITVFESRTRLANTVWWKFIRQRRVRVASNDFQTHTSTYCQIASRAPYRLFRSVVKSIELKIAILIDNHDFRGQRMRYIGRHQSKGGQGPREIFSWYELVWGQIYRNKKKTIYFSACRTRRMMIDWTVQTHPFPLLRIVVYPLLAMVSWRPKNVLVP